MCVGRFATDQYTRKRGAVDATYAVRKADLVTGKLIAGAVENIDVDVNGRVIKDGDPKMRGKPLDRTPGPDG